jgi:tRNA-modifying protein YgfZ
VMDTSPSATPRPDAGALTAARDGAVVCDLAPFAVLAIAGTDAVKFLNGQLSIDVGTLDRAACRYACFNTPKGRMLANFVLWRDPSEAESFRALLPAEIAPGVTKRLAMYVLRSKVTLADASATTARFGVGGPGGARAMRAALG